MEGMGGFDVGRGATAIPGAIVMAAQAFLIQQPCLAEYELGVEADDKADRLPGQYTIETNRPDKTLRMLLVNNGFTG